jgi:hypothetical protein
MVGKYFGQFVCMCLLTNLEFRSLLKNLFSCDCEYCT